MSRTTRRLLILWSIIGLLALREFLGIQSAKHELLIEATKQSQTLSRAMAQSMATSLHSADKILQASAAMMSQPPRHAGKIDKASLRTILARHAAMLPGVLDISVTDAAGHVIHSSVDIASDVSLSGLAYFKLLRETSNRMSDAAAVVSPVQPTPFGGNSAENTGRKAAVQMARAYTSADGRFAGVVVISLGVEDHFQPLFQNQSPSATTSLALIDKNQRILLRLPLQEGRVGQYLNKPRKMSTDNSAAAITYYEYEGVDGQRRIGTGYDVAGYPLQVGVTERYDVVFSALDDIYHKAIVFILVLLTAGGFLTVLLWRDGKSELTGRLNQSVFQNSLEGILITDPESRIIDANPRLLEMCGYTREELIGKTPAVFRSDRHPPEFHLQIREALQHRDKWRGDIWNRAKDGTPYAQHSSISAVRDSKGHLTHYVGLFSDITEIKTQAEKLEQMAYFDALTGLPNRRLLADRLQQAIAQATRSSQLLAVCYLDLDGFKPINDTWGHAAGDRLLVKAAERLTTAVRAGDTVSRLGGDEFVVLLGDLGSLEECELALERVRSSLCEPYRLNEGTAIVSASIGATVYPIDKADADTLIRHADQAMYSAKQDGRNRFQFFDTGNDHPSQARHAALDSIRQAIANDEFLLYYQPKVNMRSGRIIGAEALIRWQHPDRGLLNPGEFLPVVEFVGMQIELGNWVLRNAIHQIAQWAESGHPVAVSINVAAEQLQAEGFTDRLRQLLADHPAARAELVELELLETAALHDLTAVSGVIDHCRDLGIHFAIDDFGTGYSSLTYLKQLHAQTLKIDQSFVRDMLEDPEDLAIVDGVIGLASVFRRQVVAEGVETPAHGRLLMELGCDLAQGYGIARPMPADKLLDWMRDWKAPEEWRGVSLIPREDLPLVTMPIHHHRWVKEFQTVINEQEPGNQSQKSPFPALDPSQCEFGRWLKENGRRRYGHLLAFRELEASHLATHHRAQELASLWQTDPDAARARLPELDSCRDTLFAVVEELRTMALGHL